MLINMTCCKYRMPYFLYLKQIFNKRLITYFECFHTILFICFCFAIDIHATLDLCCVTSKKKCQICLSASFIIKLEHICHLAVFPRKK